MRRGGVRIVKGQPLGREVEADGDVGERRHRLDARGGDRLRWRADEWGEAGEGDLPGQAAHFA